MQQLLCEYGIFFTTTALGLIIGIPVAIVGSIPLCVLGVACIVTTYKYGIRLYRRRSTDYSTNVQTPSKHPMVVTTSMEVSVFCNITISDSMAEVMISSIQ